MLNAPIPRMGGKSKLRKEIIKRIPEHSCYVEPFFGVGWVFFGKEASKVEVINDIDCEIVNLFKMIKYHNEEINRLLKFEICSRYLFEEYKILDSKNLTEIQRAVRLIYLVSQSFGSRGGVFGYGTSTRPSPQIFGIQQLSELKERLRNTYIENIHFQKIFEKYDRTHTFFFCDPPYLNTTGYGTDFGIEEHIRLNKILKNIKGKFLLTINDNTEIREMYKNFNIEETEVLYTVSKDAAARKNYKELIITNYSI